MRQRHSCSKGGRLSRTFFRFIGITSISTASKEEKFTSFSSAPKGGGLISFSPLPLGGGARGGGTLIRTILCCSLTFASAAVLCDDLKNSITIYSTIASNPNYASLYKTENSNAIPGYAIVRQQKDIEFKTGLNKVIFTGIPSGIDPTTMLFKSLSYPENSAFLSQEYRFDLTNNQELLRKYIGQEITVEQNTSTKTENYTGKLLSATGAIILEDKNGDIISLNNYTTIHFSKLNSGLFTEPTLICDIATDKAGMHRIETSYLTEGLSWWTEYNAILQETTDNTSNQSNKDNMATLELAAWVNIINKSGIVYNGIFVNLMAGEPNRIAPSPMLAGSAMAFRSTKMGANESSANLNQMTFFEYHLYSLGRKIDLPNNTIKQLELFPKIHQIPVELQYFYSSNEVLPYYGQPNLNREPGIPFNTNAETIIKFKNSKAAGLGIPLPAGRFRINKMEPNGGLLFIGESSIQHTPKEQEIFLKIGAAFDITIERIQTNFKVDEQRRTMEESYELKVKNQKDKNIILLVNENLYRAAHWQIVNNSEKYEKKDAQTIEFRLPVKKGDEAKLSYTVKYNW